MSEELIGEELRGWCEEKDYEMIASYFINTTGSNEEARSLLENVLALIPSDNMNSRKRPAPSSPTTLPKTPGELDFFMNDSVDEAAITALLLIPNEHTVIGSIIGPQGKNIKQMTAGTGCLVNIDQKSQSAKDRTAPITVFLQGGLQSVVKVAELLSMKVESLVSEHVGSAPWVGKGCGINRTVMIIPDPSVRRIIGKSGITIIKLQQDAGIEIQLQNESKMAASPDPLFGREAILTGSLHARLHGLYLICRILVDDKDCPSSWKTLHQFPSPMRGGAAPQPGGKGGFGFMMGLSQPAPPQPPPHLRPPQPPQPTLNHAYQHQQVHQPFQMQQHYGIQPQSQAQSQPQVYTAATTGRVQVAGYNQLQQPVQQQPQQQHAHVTANATLNRSLPVANYNAQTVQRHHQPQQHVMPAGVTSASQVCQSQVAYSPYMPHTQQQQKKK